VLSIKKPVKLRIILRQYYEAIQRDDDSFCQRCVCLVRSHAKLVRMQMAADRAPRHIDGSVSRNKMAAGPQGLDLEASVALRSCIFCLLLFVSRSLYVFFFAAAGLKYRVTKPHTKSSLNQK